MKICDEGLVNLGIGIVEQAAKDYLFAKKVIHVEGDLGNEEYTRTIRECIKFFKSNWYIRLINEIDGEYLLKLLDREFEAFTKDEEELTKFKRMRKRE